jgi:hypothetical protein
MRSKRTNLRTTKSSRAGSSGVSAPSKRDIAAGKIVAILEEHMSALGLTEAQKDRKVKEMAVIVHEAIKAKKSPRAKHSRPSRIAASPA